MNKSQRKLNFDLIINQKHKMKIPIEIIYKIQLYNIHPVAYLLKPYIVNYETNPTEKHKRIVNRFFNYLSIHCRIVNQCIFCGRKIEDMGSCDGCWPEYDNDYNELPSYNNYKRLFPKKITIRDN